jgi:pyruvate/2-oxoglutarate/acetoin dehydrogenase E1 component
MCLLFLLFIVMMQRCLDGREVLNACFDANFERDKSIVAFGEDVGAIGDVNQGFAGLQAKYGDLRITDTGIRETSIIGQGMGLGYAWFKANCRDPIS